MKRADEGKDEQKDAVYDMKDDMEMDVPMRARNGEREYIHRRAHINIR